MKKRHSTENIPSNYFRRSISKFDENTIVSKIEDYQTSMSTFSAKFDNKILTNSFKEKNKTKKRVEFNPLITVINIQSYKKENYLGIDNSNNNDESNDIKKCISCNIF